MRFEKPRAAALAAREAKAFGGAIFGSKRIRNSIWFSAPEKICKAIDLPPATAHLPSDQRRPHRGDSFGGRVVSVSSPARGLHRPRVHPRTRARLASLRVAGANTGSRSPVPRYSSSTRREWPRTPLPVGQVRRAGPFSASRRPGSSQTRGTRTIRNPEIATPFIEPRQTVPLHLCRLRYFGNEKAWTIAFYTYSGKKYEPCVFGNGTFHGTPEEAFEIGADLSQRLVVLGRHQPRSGYEVVPHHRTAEE